MTGPTPGASASPADGPGRDASVAHPFAVQVGLLVTAVLVVLDQATKQLAESLLERGRFVPLVGDAVGWQLVYNPGGAFGFPAPIWIFLVVTVIVVVLVIRSLPRATLLTAAVAYGMLLAGAVGNVLDRLFRAGDDDRGFAGGHVVDFVAWGSFPRFNVADSAITVGFVLLVIGLFLEERRTVAGEASTTDEGEAAPHGVGTGDLAADDGTDDRAGGRAPGPDA